MTLFLGLGDEFRDFPLDSFCRFRIAWSGQIRRKVLALFHVEREACAETESWKSKGGKFRPSISLSFIVDEHSNRIEGHFGERQLGDDLPVVGDME